MRALLRACMYAVACAAGVDTYLYGSWWAEHPLGMPLPAAHILALSAGLIVAVVTATVPWKIYVAIRRSTTARRRALATAATAVPTAPRPTREPEPAEAETTPRTVPTQPTTPGPPRDAPYREAAVLPSPQQIDTPVDLPR